MSERERYPHLKNDYVLWDSVNILQGSTANCSLNTSEILIWQWDPNLITLQPQRQGPQNTLRYDETTCCELLKRLNDVHEKQKKTEQNRPVNSSSLCSLSGLVLDIKVHM